MRLTVLGNIILLTGAVDYLSDGYRVLAINNGHEYLGRVTGVSSEFFMQTGCRLTYEYRPDVPLAPSLAHF
jgi:thiamine-phosphate diphosphorylase/hydroxyethylthiazole kinase